MQTHHIIFIVNVASHEAGVHGAMKCNLCQNEDVMSWNLQTLRSLCTYAYFVQVYFLSAIY